MRFDRVRRPAPCQTVRPATAPAAGPHAALTSVHRVTVIPPGRGACRARQPTSSASLPSTRTSVPSSAPAAAVGRARAPCAPLRAGSSGWERRPVADLPAAVQRVVWRLGFGGGAVEAQRAGPRGVLDGLGVAGRWRGRGLRGATPASAPPARSATPPRTRCRRMARRGGPRWVQPMG